MSVLFRVAIAGDLNLLNTNVISEKWWEDNFHPTPEFSDYILI